MKTKPRRGKKARRFIVERNIRTIFYADHEGRWALKTNVSAYALHAAFKAGEYLRSQHYPGAMLAEVFDLVTGQVYAIITMDRTGNIHNLYSPSADEREQLEDQLQERT